MQGINVKCVTQVAKAQERGRQGGVAWTATARTRASESLLHCFTRQERQAVAPGARPAALRPQAPSESGVPRGLPGRAPRTNRNTSQRPAGGPGAWVYHWISRPLARAPGRKAGRLREAANESRTYR